MSEFNPAYAIRISAKNFGFENNIKSVPLYAAFCLENKQFKLNATVTKKCKKFAKKMHVSFFTVFYRLLLRSIVL